MASRKTLKEKEKTITSLERYEILDKINMMEGHNPDRDKALVAFLYLTGCRIEEVVKYKLEKNPHRTLIKREKFTGADGSMGEKKYNIPYPILKNVLKGRPILKKQIEVGEDYIVVRNVRSLKRREAIKRSVPIILTKQDQPFITLFFNYLKTLDDDDEIFPMNRSRAFQILDRVGLFPHWLRHSRLTHLTTHYGFNEMELQQFTGWKDSRASAHYVHLNVDNLLDKMRSRSS